MVILGAFAYQMDRRFQDLRSEMNHRFEDLYRYLDMRLKAIDDRLEKLERRAEVIEADLKTSFKENP